MEYILTIIFVLIIIIYILQLTPILSKDVFTLMNNYYVKMILIVLILLLSYLNPSLGLIFALSFLIIFLYMHNNLSVSFTLNNTINEQFTYIKNDLQKNNINSITPEKSILLENQSKVDNNINKKMNERMKKQIEDNDIWNKNIYVDTENTSDDCENKEYIKEKLKKIPYQGVSTTDSVFNTFMKLA